MKDHMENRSEMKIAKRALSKVFVSSVCTILICVACLAGTAWAWYSAYIENTGSVIHIGEAKVTVTIGGTEVSSGVEVSPEENEGSHMIVTHGGSEDAFRKRSTIYMTVSANGKSCGYVELTQKAVIILHPEIECELKWETSWAEPQEEQLLADLAGTIRFEIVEAEETTPETTAPMESEPSEPATEAATEPSEPAATTEPTTAPSEPDPTTQPTTAPSEPDPTTAPTTAPSEPDPTTAPTTAPSEPNPTTQPEPPATEAPTAPPKQDPPATEASAATEATGGEGETT